MLLLLVTFALLIIEVTLATFVATRAWDYRPARLFVLVVATMITINTATFLKVDTTDPQLAYTTISISFIGLAGFEVTLLLLISNLFMPQWWQDPRAIRWIILPFLLVTAALTIDLIGQTGLFVNGGNFASGDYRLNLTRPGGSILLVVFIGSWLVHLIMLAVAFVKRRQERPMIVLVFMSIVIVLALSRSPFPIPLLRQLPGVFYTIPILTALAYAVLRTRLLVPTQAAFDLALRAMSEAVAVLDDGGKVIYVNPQAETLGFQHGQPFRLALAAAGASTADVEQLAGETTHLGTAVEQKLGLGDRRIAISLAPVTDLKGHTRGMLVLGRDITEIETHTAQLERERARLATAVEMLEAERQERSQLAATVQALSLPLIPVLEGVLVLPLIGAFDLARVDQFMSVLLEGIERERAHLVLIDLTGMPLLDPDGAQSILSAVRAAGLLGARCVLVGVRPEIAQTLVTFGMVLAKVSSAATLQQALQRELRLLPTSAAPGSSLRA